MKVHEQDDKYKCISGIFIWLPPDEYQLHMDDVIVLLLYNNNNKFILHV